MTSSTVLRQKIADKIGFKVSADAPDAHVLDRVQQEGFARLHLRYKVSDGDVINAYLLIPDSSGPHPGVIAFHQHNSQWEIGKSEVCGLVGDSFQAFAPELSRRGICVLAPDAVGFESRCQTAGAGKSFAPNLTRPGSTTGRVAAVLQSNVLLPGSGRQYTSQRPE